MIEALPPDDEAARLAALLEYNILDTDQEQAYDDLTLIASQICQTPIALVSLVDGERQWFKSRVGLDASQTPRSVAFCSHAILEPDEVFIVPDSLDDERFRDNPLAVGAPHVRFYAGAPLVNSDGYPLGTLCVIDNKPREMTATEIDTLRALSRQVVSQLELRKRNRALIALARQVEHANDDLRSFTSIAAHDLREPLRTITSFADLLERDAGDDLPERAAQDLGFIVESADRMNRLISSLLELTRAGSGELETKSANLGDCVNDALDAIRSRIEGKNAQIEVDPLPPCRVEATLMTQVFQNLIGNALKFTESERPKIRVTCSVEDGATVLGVQDNGIGVDPRFAEEIFVPFKRLHGSQGFEGTGIGLAIVRKIVERHGGRIWVESTPGEGSHFRFTLAGWTSAPNAVLAAA